MTSPKCGTYAGYNQHVLHREIACDDCLASQRSYARWRRFRIGAQHDVRRCPECGSIFEEHRCVMG